MIPDFTDVFAAVIGHVEGHTGKRCYDAVPLDPPKEFYALVMTNQEPISNKNMKMEGYWVDIHGYSIAGDSSIPINRMNKELCEAMSRPITLPCRYQLMEQRRQGMAQIITEEDGAKHSIVGFYIQIAFGFGAKN